MTIECVKNKNVVTPIPYLQQKEQLLLFWSEQLFERFWALHFQIVDELSRPQKWYHLLTHHLWIRDLLLSKDEIRKHPYSAFFDKFILLLDKMGELEQLEQNAEIYLDTLLRYRLWDKGIHFLDTWEPKVFRYRWVYYRTQFFILQNNQPELEKVLTFWCSEEKRVIKRLDQEGLKYQIVLENIFHLLSEHWSEFSPSARIKEFILRYYLSQNDFQESRENLEKMINMFTESLLLFPTYAPFYLLGFRIYWSLKDYLMAKIFADFIDNVLKNKRADFVEINRVQKEFKEASKRLSSLSVEQLKQKRDYSYKKFSMEENKGLDFTDDMNINIENHQHGLDETKVCKAHWEYFESRDRYQEYREKQDFYFQQESYLPFFVQMPNEKLIKEYPDWIITFNFMGMYALSHKILKLIDSLFSNSYDLENEEDIKAHLRWYYLRIITFEQEEDYEGALPYLEEVCNFIPLKNDETLTFYYIYGEIWRKLGERNLALGWYRKVATIDDRYRQTRQRILELEKN